MGTLQAGKNGTVAGNIRICEECGVSLGKTGGMIVNGVRQNFHTKCPPKIKGHKKHGGWGNGNFGQFYKKPKNPEILPSYNEF